MDNRPIGVFDSGLGGLTGVRELRKRLPHEDIIYFGDTGRVPYGSRSPETILQYARILGCTHYPLLKSMIGEFMGPGVTLVDPAMTAAHHLERMLAERGLRASHESGQAHFYVSDVPDSFVQTADLFLGEYKGGPVEQIAIDKY